MTIKNSKEIIFSLFLLSIVYVIQIRLSNNIPALKFKISKDDTSINIRDNYLKVFNMGQKRFISSLMWVHTLLAADEKQYKGVDFENWMFLRFKSISLIDKNFYENYRYGGLYLSIIKDDDLAVEYIFDKGLSLFPKDYWLNYFGAYHYFFERNNPEKALVHYKFLLTLPEAQEKFGLLPHLIARIEASHGSLSVAYELLLDTYNKLPQDSKMKARFETNLYALKAEIDLDCLNSGKKDCNYQDFEQNPYLKSLDGKYRARKYWQKYEILGKKKVIK